MQSDRKFVTLAAMDGAAVIETFGGRSEVARLTGADPNAVTQWRYTGVPYRYWPRLIEYAAAHGIPGITFATLEKTRPYKAPKEPTEKKAKPRKKKAAA